MRCEGERGVALVVGLGGACALGWDCVGDTYIDLQCGGMGWVHRRWCWGAGVCMHTGYLGCRCI